MNGIFETFPYYGFGRNYLKIFGRVKILVYDTAEFKNNKYELEMYLSFCQRCLGFQFIDHSKP
jgi:hypothetical protein